MASKVPPQRGVAYYTEIALISQADTKLFLSGAAFQAGDIVIYKDGILDGNIDVDPVELGSTGVYLLQFSATEMTCDRIACIIHDQAGAAFCDMLITIDTVTNRLDDVATPADVLSIASGGTTTAAIADAVLNEAGAGHTGLIPTNLDAKVSSVSGAAAQEPPRRSDLPSWQ